MHRDTQKCAFKCSYAIVNGEGVNVYKEPITDQGKTSKKGVLSLELEEGKYVTKTEGSGDPSKVGVAGEEVKVGLCVTRSVRAPVIVSLYCSLSPSPR